MTFCTLKSKEGGSLELLYSLLVIPNLVQFHLYWFEPYKRGILNNLLANYKYLQGILPMIRL